MYWPEWDHPALPGQLRPLVQRWERLCAEHGTDWLPRMPPQVSAALCVRSHLVFAGIGSRWSAYPPIWHRVGKRTWSPSAGALLLLVAARSLAYDRINPGLPACAGCEHVPGPRAVRQVPAASGGAGRRVGSRPGLPVMRRAVLCLLKGEQGAASFQRLPASLAGTHLPGGLFALTARAWRLLQVVAAIVESDFLRAHTRYTLYSGQLAEARR